MRSYTLFPTAVCQRLPSTSATYQMSIKINDVNDSPGVPYVTAGIAEFATTDFIVVPNLRATDPDSGDVHTWELDQTANSGGTFYIEQDSMTDIFKIAVNNQGYTCTVEFGARCKW